MSKNAVLSDEQVLSAAGKASEKVLLSHLQSFATNDLDALMSDYTEQSVLITHEQTYSGVQEIRSFFVELLTHFPKNRSNFNLDKLVVKDELVYIVWHATTPSLEVPLGTDTFVVKQGKIYQQTFAGQLNFFN